MRPVSGGSQLMPASQDANKLLALPLTVIPHYAATDTAVRADMDRCRPMLVSIYHVRVIAMMLHTGHVWRHVTRDVQERECSTLIASEPGTQLHAASCCSQSKSVANTLAQATLLRTHKATGPRATDLQGKTVTWS